MVSFKLNDTEIEQCTDLLSRLDPGYLPFSLFLQVYRLTPAPVLQIVFIRPTKKGPEVLLLQRPDDDVLWPSLWHNPGTVFRANDTFDRAKLRLLNDELGGTEITKDLVFVGNIFNHSDRGLEIVQTYWVAITGPVKKGVFWPEGGLPEQSIESDMVITKKALEHYNNSLHTR